jgi:inhibitor of KinA
MSTYHPYTIFPLGDAALTVEFSNTIDKENNNKAIQLFHQLREAKIPYIKSLVPGYSSLTVHYDVVALYNEQQTAFETMAVMIENFTEERKPSYSNVEEKLINIPVCYEKKFAPDLFEVASLKNLSPEEVISIHSSREYRVYMLGFVPGFAYMGEVDEAIAVPRRDQPRLQVDAGSVGITGKQTGIYPFNTPGGWQIIGRTPLKLFNKEEEQPVLLQPGNRIKFHSITADEFKDYQSRNA